MRKVALMLKAIHAQESCEAAQAKAQEVVGKLKAMRLSKVAQWLEESVEETLTYYRLPRQHHKHMKSTNMLKQLNQELKRRTHVVRIFPNAASCLRLIRALAVETHENWLEATRYLNVAHLAEHKKELLRAVEEAA